MCGLYESISKSTGFFVTHQHPFVSTFFRLLKSIYFADYVINEENIFSACFLRLHKAPSEPQKMFYKGFFYFYFHFWEVRRNQLIMKPRPQNVLGKFRE